MDNPQQPQQPVQSPQTTPVNYPGKTMGIVGFIFAFIGLQLIGVILSAISFKKAKDAGVHNSLAFAGIILNAVLFFVAIIGWILIAITFISYSGITARAQTSSSNAAALTVVKWSELYNADYGTYPTTFSQLSTYNSSDTGITASPSLLVTEPSVPTVIEFFTCGTEGNRIGHWSYITNHVEYDYSGTASEDTDCTLTAS